MRHPGTPPVVNEVAVDARTIAVEDGVDITALVIGQVTQPVSGVGIAGADDSPVRIQQQCDFGNRQQWTLATQVRDARAKL
jgi:hypothetical protein